MIEYIQLSQDERDTLSEALSEFEKGTEWIGIVRSDREITTLRLLSKPTVNQEATLERYLSYLGVLARMRDASKNKGNIERLATVFKWVERGYGYLPSDAQERSMISQDISRDYLQQTQLF